jgi:hypothetical protein
MGIDDESSHPRLCSEVADGVARNIVCLFREPDAGNLPVRFDEREQETEARPNRIEAGEAKAQPNSHREAKATAPVLDSTPVGVEKVGSTMRFPSGSFSCSCFSLRRLSACGNNGLADPPIGGNQPAYVRSSASFALADVMHFRGTGNVV